MGFFLSHLCRKVSQSFAKGGGICIRRSRELQEGTSVVRRLPVVADCGTASHLQCSLRLWSSLSAAGFELSRYGSARIQLCGPGLAVVLCLLHQISRRIDPIQPCQLAPSLLRSSEYSPSRLSAVCCVELF